MALFILLSLVLVSCQSRGPVSTEPRFIHVEGHRGARAVRPENSLPAFEYALSVGVDVLEFDMAVTKDKRVVITHDPYINPDLCVNKKGRPVPKNLLIKDLTLKEVKTYECGLTLNSRFPNQKLMKAQIPTLEEVFDLVNLSTFSAAKTVRFNIETKIFQQAPQATWDVNTFVAAVLGVLKKYQLGNRVVIQSFDFRSLRRIRELQPELRLAALTEENTHPLKTLGDLKVEILSPNYKTIDRKIVDKAHSMGMTVVPWTVNDAEGWDLMIALNVDGIISDNPGDLLNFLKAKGYHP